MNDTPRTDAFWDRMPFGRPFLSEVRKFARQLERELDNMTDQRDAAIWCHEKCREDRLRVIEQRDRLAEAGQAVVDRWHTPLWKDVPHTAKFIQNLEAALASVKGGANE